MKTYQPKRFRAKKRPHWEKPPFIYAKCPDRYKHILKYIMLFFGMLGFVVQRTTKSSRQQPLFPVCPNSSKTAKQLSDGDKSLVFPAGDRWHTQSGQQGQNDKVRWNSYQIQISCELKNYTCLNISLTIYD